MAGVIASYNHYFEKKRTHMNYIFGHLVVAIIRFVCLSLLLVNLLVFMLVLIFVIPPAVQHGREHGFHLDGRTQPASKQIPREVGSPDISHSNVIADAAIYGGGSVAFFLTLFLMLACCDVVAAILDSATNTKRILLHLKAQIDDSKLPRQNSERTS